MKRYKIGIALSGGGSKGFAHLGVLKALNEFGIFPEIVSGTSAGSIAGAFYCAGYKPNEILEIFEEKKLWDLTKFHIPKDGLLNLENLSFLIDKYIKYKNIEELPIPLIICITNMNDAKAEYIYRGKINLFVKASASIPVVFSPVKIKNTYYVDGGLIDNFPVRPLFYLCDRIIGVNVYPFDKTEKLESMIQIATRTFQIAINKNIRYYQRKCDLYIEPSELAKYNILELKYHSEIFDIGYKYCKNILSNTDISNLKI